MMMTTLLLIYFLEYKLHWPGWLVGILFAVFTIVESSFFIANIIKLKEAWMMLIVYIVLLHVMWVTFMYRKMSNYFLQFEDLDNYVGTLRELSNDKSVPKYATHLVFLTKANFHHQVEKKIMESILAKTPKRADIYWFVHVNVMDDPYTMEYSVETVIPNEIIRIEFRLGFRVDQRIQMMFRKVVEDMVNNKEVNIVSRYESLSKNNVKGDFRFIVIEKFLSLENELPLYERLIMRGYFFLKKYSLSEERGFGLDPSDVTLEKFPLIIKPSSFSKLVRKD
jgi:KUP system potassium uptake protein